MNDGASEHINLLQYVIHLDHLRSMGGGDTGGLPPTGVVVGSLPGTATRQAQA